MIKLTAQKSSTPQGEINHMKKIMGVLLSTSLFLGAVSVVFAQGTGTSTSTTKKSTKKSKKDTKTSTATKS